MAALTLPVQALVLERLAHGNHSVAERWIASLDDAGLRNVALNLGQYPLEYRRLIAPTLSPELKAELWRENTLAFLRDRPDLEPQQHAAVARLLQLAVPETFHDEGKAVLQQASDVIRAQLGPEAHARLFLTAQPQITTGLPVSVRIRTFIENRLVVQAFDPDCNCNHMFGYHPNIDCDGGTLVACSEIQGCDYTIWGCGGQFPWNYNCDGYCMPLGSS